MSLYSFANFTILGICMCYTELLPWKNQKRAIRYLITLQIRDSIADIFSRVDLGTGYRRHMLLRPPPFFLELRTSKTYKNKQHNTPTPIELRLKEMACLMIIADTKKTFSAFQFFH